MRGAPLGARFRKRRSAAAGNGRVRRMRISTLGHAPAAQTHSPGGFTRGSLTFRIGGPWILAPSATGLSKPDLHVFAKLFEDCLKRGLEAQAFSGREIGGHDDVLDFLVGHFVDVDLTRQPAS